MREFVLAGRRIADDTPAYLVAEVGNNHGGLVRDALALVRMSAGCGADAVKFQARDNATLYSQALLNRDYRNAASFGDTYGAHRVALELPDEGYVAIAAQAQRVGIPWFATAFDERSADRLLRLGVQALKIASGGVTDVPLLTHCRSLGVPVVLSTGGSSLAEIDRAVAVLGGGSCALAVLHCTAAYPADYAELNLRCITTLRERYPELVIGWSGHDVGIAMSVAAYMLGARIIEKHVTLNRTAKGTDHAFSLEPSGLRRLARDLARAHHACGDGVKRVYASEAVPLAKMRRTHGPEGYKIYG